jgi:hypothetical protein
LQFLSVILTSITQRPIQELLFSLTKKSNYYLSKKGKKISPVNFFTGLIYCLACSVFLSNYI